MLNNMIREKKTTPTKYEPLLLLLLHRLCCVFTNETKVEFKPTTFKCGVMVFVIRLLLYRCAWSKCKVYENSHVLAMLNQRRRWRLWYACVSANVIAVDFIRSLSHSLPLSIGFFQWCACCHSYNEINQFRRILRVLERASLCFFFSVRYMIFLVKPKVRSILTKAFRIAQFNLIWLNPDKLDGSYDHFQIVFTAQPQNRAE